MHRGRSTPPDSAPRRGKALQRRLTPPGRALDALSTNLGHRNLFSNLLDYMACLPLFGAFNAYPEIRQTYQ